MIVWLDAQLSPRLARWIEETFEVECVHVRDLGLRNAEDPEIFQKARDALSVVMTKDEDFVRLVERKGPPPQVIWITSGNMPNARFKSLSEDFTGYNIADRGRRDGRRDPSRNIGSLTIGLRRTRQTAPLTQSVRARHELHALPSQVRLRIGEW